ncbi:30S ribosomal protein S27ae [Candidatus Micrarchaeota archaeon]|nr:30S ribosomal protein S27ae [Candidatus Micrarchaeota archaeon]
MPPEDKKKDAKPAGKPVKKERITKPYNKPGKNCPKCGTGVRLAEHANRRSCGKCGYFEKK